MAKVEVYCLIRKRPMKIEQKLADALVKMKRAEYRTAEPQEYKNRMMVSETVKTDEEKKKPGRPKKVKDEITSLD